MAKAAVKAKAKKKPMAKKPAAKKRSTKRRRAGTEWPGASSGMGTRSRAAGLVPLVL
jgi:hypothetical protein